MCESCEDDVSRCFVCGVPFADTDLVYDDVNEGTVHAECLGSSPENFVDADGEPLKPGVPIPAPWVYGGGEITLL